MAGTLLLLCKSILVSILSEWISDEDVCYLDCAYCRYDSRDLFLSILTNCKVNTVLQMRSKPNEIERAEWIINRGMIVKRLVIFGKQDLQGIRLAEHLDYLDVHLDPDSLECIEAISISVNTLKVNAGFLDWEIVKRLLRVVRNVRFLELIIYRDSTELSSVIAALCPNLTGIKFMGNLKQMVDLISTCPDLVVLEGF